MSPITTITQCHTTIEEVKATGEKCDWQVSLLQSHCTQLREWRKLHNHSRRSRPSLSYFFFMLNKPYFTQALRNVSLQGKADVRERWQNMTNNKRGSLQHHRTDQPLPQLPVHPYLNNNKRKGDEDTLTFQLESFSDMVSVNKEGFRDDSVSEASQTCCPRRPCCEGKEGGEEIEEGGWWEDLKDFSNETSAHGIRYVFNGSSRLIRLAFLILLLIFVVKLIFVIKHSIVLYLSYPTGTKYQVIASHGYKPLPIKFPTITVCSHNTVSMQYLNKRDGLREIWDTLDEWNPDKAELIDFGRTNFSKYAGTLYEDVIKGGGPQEWHLLQCEHTDNICSHDDVLGDDYMARETTLQGQCFRINPNGEFY